MPGIDIDEVYRTLTPENIPWNRPELPLSLVELLDAGRIAPCRAVEFGCGLGNHSMEMARRGFEVTGVDLSPTAIGMAKDHAQAAGVGVTFICGDVTGALDDLAGGYDFGWDWEMLHHLFPEQRPRYAANLARLLAPGALHLSVCFSEDDPMFGAGKRRVTPIGTELYFSGVEEIEALYAPHFDIVTLGLIDIQGTHGIHRAVKALLRKPTVRS